MFEPLRDDARGLGWLTGRKSLDDHRDHDGHLRRSNPESALIRDCPCGTPGEYALLTDYVDERPGGGQIVLDDHGEFDPYVCEACALDVSAASENGTRIVRIRYGLFSASEA